MGTGHVDPPRKRFDIDLGYLRPGTTARDYATYKPNTTAPSSVNAVPPVDLTPQQRARQNYEERYVLLAKFQIHFMFNLLLIGGIATRKSAARKQDNEWLGALPAYICLTLKSNLSAYATGRGQLVPKWTSKEKPRRIMKRNIAKRRCFFARFLDIRLTMTLWN